MFLVVSCIIFTNYYNHIVRVYPNSLVCWLNIPFPKCLLVRVFAFLEMSNREGVTMYATMWLTADCYMSSEWVITKCSLVGRRSFSKVERQTKKISKRETSSNKSNYSATHVHCGYSHLTIWYRKHAKSPISIPHFPRFLCMPQACQCTHWMPMNAHARECSAMQTRVGTTRAYRLLLQ